MKKMMLLAALTAVLAGCKKDGPVVPASDFSTELSLVTSNVIVKNYQTLDNQAELLMGILSVLQSNPNDTLLQSAQIFWRSTRVPWEQAEAFLFGPVSQLGIDPAIDSWPVNEVDLEQVLASGEVLTKGFLDAQPGTIKGFHTLEYLLFGKNSNKKVADFTPREFEYLHACAESLKGETAKLVNAWQASGSNFAKNLTAAGTSASIYPSQKSALNELVNGMVTIVDEVANGKINDPLTQQNVTLEESRFSANSKADFVDNIIGIRNVYFGTESGTPVASISTRIAAKDPDLDERVRVKIALAISAIEGIPGTFTTAIFDEKPAVQAAQKAVRDLQEILQGEVAAAVTGL